MDWLFEGHFSVYTILGATLVLALVLWLYDQRQRAWPILAVLALVLIGLYFLLDRLVVTDRESLQQTVQSMTDSVEAHNLDVAFAHISDQFRSPSGRSKAEFRELAESELRSGRVKAVKIWDIRFPEGVKLTGETKVTFMFKLRADLGGKEDMFFQCEAWFTHEGSKGWQMRRCRILEPMRDSEVAVPLF